VNINKNEIKFKLNSKRCSLPINNFYSQSIYEFIKFLKSNWIYKNNYWEKDGIKFKHYYATI